MGYQERLERIKAGRRRAPPPGSGYGEARPAQPVEGSWRALGNGGASAFVAEPAARGVSSTFERAVETGPAAGDRVAEHDTKPRDDGDRIPPEAIEALRAARARASASKRRLTLVTTICGLGLSLLPLSAVGFGWVVWFLTFGSDIGLVSTIVLTLACAFACLMATLGTIGTVKGLLARVRGREEVDEDDADEGNLLTRAEIPDTFEVLDVMCATAGTKPLDAVRILPNVNAYAHQESGTKRRVLGVGAPLLMLLAPERALAVIAHEIAHFAHEDTSEGRLAMSVRNGLACNGWLLRLTFVGAPVGWVMGGLSQLMDVAFAATSRSNEFAADAYAAVFAGRPATGEALTLIIGLGGDAERAAWKPLEDAWESGHELPHDMVGTLPRRIHAAYDDQRLRDFVAEHGDEEGSLFDSHPLLRERLSALSRPAELPAIDPARNSWAGFLGPALPHVVAKLEADLRAKLEGDFDDRKADVADTRVLVKAALAQVEAAPDYAAKAEAAEIAALLIERSMPFEEMRETLQDLYVRFAEPISFEDEARVAAPTAAMLILCEHLDEGDERALDPAIDLLRRCPMMAGELYPRIACLLRGRVSADLKPLAKALKDDPELVRIARGAVDNYHDEIDCDDYFEGLGNLPFEPHGLADWHAGMVVAELRKRVEAADDVLLEVALVRHARGFGGLPAFHMVYRTAGRADFEEFGSLSDRLCLPGPLGHFQTQGADAKNRMRYKAIAEHPGATIFRAEDEAFEAVRQGGETEKASRAAA